MNCIDVIFFQTELASSKLALITQGSVIPYGRLARGILSAQQRLAAIGLSAGQTVGLHVAHPIDHMVLACALYRMKVASASITHAADAYLDHVPFDMVLSDAILPTLAVKQPAAKIILVDPTWFQDQVDYTVAQRGAARRGASDWVSRITCYPDVSTTPSIVKTTSRALEAQLLSYMLSAPPNWERMISVAGVQTDSGFIQALSALWLGRSICFSDMAQARNLISIYKHDYLVATAEEVEPLLKAQETRFVALPALRAACFEGRASRTPTLKRGLAVVSANLSFRYSHPQIGLIAYGAANRFQSEEGAVGFVAPWVEAQIVDDQAAPLGPERTGTLRVRLRNGGLSVGAPKEQDSDAHWIYPQQQAKITSDNLLVLNAREINP